VDIRLNIATIDYTGKLRIITAEKISFPNIALEGESAESKMCPDSKLSGSSWLVLARTYASNMSKINLKLTRRLRAETSRSEPIISKSKL
jgi:hypothetical protein